MDELAIYIINYYPHLMTEEEHAARKSMIGQQKVQNAESLGTKNVVTAFWISKDPRVLELLADGPEAFMARVRDRIMHEHRDEVFLHHCPRCGALAKTPRAKQCPKCFFSWHES